VARDVDGDALKKAFRKLSKKVHPDRNPAEGATEAFKALQKAYEILEDDQKRRYYDQTGAESPQAAAAANGGGGGGFGCVTAQPSRFVFVFVFVRKLPTRLPKRCSLSLHSSRCVGIAFVRLCTSHRCVCSAPFEQASLVVSLPSQHNT
jgi:curved DNA-binding protein CbpA